MSDNHHKPSKRQRTSRSTYYDSVTIDDDDDYLAVYHREGRLRKVGNNSLPATTSRSVASDNVYWAAKVTWGPPDDPNFALDVDGFGYDNAVEAEVMEEADEPVVKAKNPRSRVSVSKPVPASHLLMVLTVL